MKRLGFAASKTVSRTRSFKMIGDSKLQDLRKTQLKKRTEAKMMWGMQAYCEWRMTKLGDPETFDVRILRADLNDVTKLCVSDFEYSMCKFLAEVVKVKDGQEYPGRTLYQFCVAIQKYLFSKGLKWKLIDGDQFENLRNVLDNLIKERAAKQIGTTVRRAELISQKHETIMWEKGILGEATPTQLRETVLFLIGIHIGLRPGDEHYNLRRDSDTNPSQLSFKRNEDGLRCLVYTEDCITKTNDGGLKSMKKERKVVWVYPSQNKVRCPVRLIDKYISLLPPVRKNRKSNFYLRSLDRVTPAQWYGEQVVGLNSIKKVIKTLAENANLEGFFTNHSLHRTGTTRLFQAGINRKIIKEYTGHSSDAVDKYQITSHDQRKELSAAITGESVQKNKGNGDMNGQCNFEFSLAETNPKLECSCTSRVIDSKDFDKLGKMISDILDKKKGSNSRVKLSIEIDC